MWSSEHTPVLSAPVSVVASPVDRPWGHFSARQSPAAIIGVPAGCRMETILKERLPDEQQQQRHQQRPSQNPRPSARSNKRAIFGRLRGMLSRSRSSSQGPLKPSGVRPSSLDASATVRRPATDSRSSSNMCRSAPVPRRLQKMATTTTTTTAAAKTAEREEEEEQDRAGEGGGGGPGEKPKTPSERGGREENFHAAMDNELVHVAFAAFCKRTLSWENVEFVRQVRELEQLCSKESTTTNELCQKLRSVAAEFVSPDSATEVNVKGSTREDVLYSIQAALDAAGAAFCDDDDDDDDDSDCGQGGWGGGRESPWARVLAIAATEALVGLARQVHTVIFDGIWPRFLASDEFAVLMKREEMRATGFTDLDGKVIVKALPPQHRGAGGPGGGGGAARGKLPTSHKRQLSSRLVSSFRVTRSAGGGGGSGRGGGSGQEGGDESVAPAAARGGGGSTEKDPLSSKTSPATSRSLSMTSGLSSNSSSSSGGGGGSLSLSAVGSATGDDSAVAHGNARPPLGRRSFGRSTPASSSTSPCPSSRPPRTLQQPSNSGGTDSCQLKQQQHHHHHHQQYHGMGGLSARWAGASRARKNAGGAMAGGGRSGLGSSPASPTKSRVCAGSRSSVPFSAGAAARRAFSLR